MIYWCILESCVTFFISYPITAASVCVTILFGFWLICDWNSLISMLDDLITSVKC